MTVTGRSRSLKVTDFGTDQKHMCNFVLVNNVSLNIAPFLSYCGILVVKLCLLTGSASVLVPGLG